MSIWYCHVYYIEVRKFNYMLESDSLKNSLQNILDVLKGDFWVFVFSNDALLVVLAKTLLIHP